MLYEAGVLSFKIEGRMKRPEYVSAAVTACRNAVDGIRDEKLLSDLDAVFSRSGHTDGYLKGNLGHEMFGTRSKDDVVAAAPILKDLEQLYTKETRSTPVSFHFTARLGEPLRLTAEWTDPESGTALLASADSGDQVAEAAQNAATTGERIVQQLQKTGGTGFHAEDIAVYAEPGLFLPASALNDLRRTALSDLKESICKQAVKSFDRECAEQVLNRRNTLAENGDPETELLTGTKLVRLHSEHQLPEAPYLLEHTELAWVLPLDTPLSTFKDLNAGHVTFGVEVPRGLYENTDRVRRQLSTVSAYGASFAFTATLDSLELAKAAGLPAVGSFTMNVFNSIARSEYRRLGVSRMTLSQEMTFRQMHALTDAGTSPQESGLLVYGRSPLMLTRNAPDGLHANDFADPMTLPELTDRKGVRFPVDRNGDAYELLNSVPLYLGDRQNDLPGGLFHLYWFTDESPDDVKAVLQQYETGAPAGHEFTRGLYQKGVL